MKGIILAGGSGTRLNPATLSVSKQIIPIYDKPMIYYPLSVLMLSQIREILIISTPRDISLFKDLLGDGSQFGLSLEYAIQDEPRGLAEAFIIGEKFIGNDNVCLVLGDNLFYGNELPKKFIEAKSLSSGAVIFGHRVSNPDRYGVVQFDENLNVLSIEEKPLKPKSKFAVTGLYYYDNDVIDIAKSIKPSQRGELEITSVNEAYLKMKKLRLQVFGRGSAWLDTGTHSSLLEASNFVHAIEKRQGIKIACLEEIAFKNKWIDLKKLQISYESMRNSEYGQYLKQLIEEF
jgi:glucose-1-phosphate thymidylyltransferase